MPVDAMDKLIGTRVQMIRLGALKKPLLPPSTIAGRMRQKVSNMPIKPNFTFSPFPT